MPASKFVKLNTRALMPTVGLGMLSWSLFADKLKNTSLGTWKSKPGAVEHAVEFALKHGYRHIDTAAAYQNEAEVGMGIKASGVPRSEIFLTTKLPPSDHTNVAQSLAGSLQKLGTGYIDLCAYLLVLFCRIILTHSLF